MSTEAVGGPVSVVLEAELRTRVRRQGVVVWLDGDGHYTAFVDRLRAAREAGSLPYAVHALRGSYLELMLALDGVAAGVDKPPLVVHLPGVTRETVRETPMLELYLAGNEFRKALDTLVAEAAAGRVAPDRIEAFRRSEAFRSVGGLSLEGADAWLDAAMDAQSGGAGARLRAMGPAAVFDELLGSSGLAATVGATVGQGDDEAALWAQLAAWLGLPESWRAEALPEAAKRAEDIAFAGASWALCVEYVDDLRRPPESPQLFGARALSRPVIDACRAVAAHLRERHPAFYRRTATETEALLVEEVEGARAEDLGRIDTFRFEEDTLLSAALDALGQGGWDQAAVWASQRQGAAGVGASFWLRDDPNRLAVWQLVDDAARLGQASAAAGERLGVGEVGGRGAAVDAYLARGAAVDRAHRLLEQRRVALLYPQVPAFERLRDRLDGMRRAWQGWADGWARDFNALCGAVGFVPEAGLQQRALFDEVVRPLTREPGVTALFVIDALRFEMGEALFQQLDGMAATTTQLRARLAELPTITAVGMNALAPVARGGRLTAVRGPRGVMGFSTGEFQVVDPESRRRAMHDRVGGGTCPWLTLDEVVRRDVTSLRRAVAQARLVVVHGQEIDEAGEKGVGPSVFDHAMQKLRAGWRLLRDAGVRRFVFTSDHGFLLLDEGATVAQAHGRRIDPKRRYVISEVAADHPGEVRVPLAALGYEGERDHLMFPETTAVFDRGRRPSAFVHGGNSLQERVIPVLTVVHRSAAGASTGAYAIQATAREQVADLHCLEVRVEAVAQGALDFSGPRTIELALHALDAAGVQVELCQARGPARVEGGVVTATVGESFELFFRLSGPSDARVLVELHHPSAVAEVAAAVPDARFAVSAARAVLVTAPPLATSAPAGTAPPPSARPARSPPPSAAPPDWLDRLDGPEVRQLFAHLAAHGIVAEAEAATMLGGQRALRRFSSRLEEHLRHAPFTVRIDVVGGVKRYVREGGP